VGDLADPDFLTRAFRDAGAVFAMIPQRFDVADYHADQRRLVAGVIAALEAAAVPRVVALSTPGARLRLGLPAALADFEDRLRTVPGLSTVVLQPTYYMENFLASIPMIASADITGGAVRGDLAFPMVATRDVADVAAGYLEKPAFAGYGTRVLLGPRDYTFQEASGILGASIGKPGLPYTQIPYDGFRHGLVGAGVSASTADAFLDMIRAMNEERMLRGLARDASSTTPTTLEQFARDVFAPVYRGTA
jgi:uncharacterized protein YbjT (DUF2867 family)